MHRFIVSFDSSVGIGDLVGCYRQSALRLINTRTPSFRNCRFFGIGWEAHKMASEESNGTGPDKQDATALASRLQHLSISAQTIHADDFLNSHSAVAPPMHVSTTFRYSQNPDDLDYMKNANVSLASLYYYYYIIDVLSRVFVLCRTHMKNRG